MQIKQIVVEINEYYYFFLKRDGLQALQLPKAVVECQCEISEISVIQKKKTLKEINSKKI